MNTESVLALSNHHTRLKGQKEEGEVIRGWKLGRGSWHSDPPPLSPERISYLRGRINQLFMSQTVVELRLTKIGKNKVFLVLSSSFSLAPTVD